MISKEQARIAGIKSGLVRRPPEHLINQARSLRAEGHTYEAISILTGLALKTAWRYTRHVQVLR